MADLIQIPEEALQSVAEQIGERLHQLRSLAAAEPSGFDSETDVGELASSEFEMWETLGIWGLRAGAPDLTQTREDLVTLMRPSFALHHQIKAAPAGGEKKAVAYAQSVSQGPLGRQFLRDLYFSPLAGRIDKAITVADEQFPGEATVRLLSLPEYKVEALWFLRQVDDVKPPRIESHVIVVDAPPSFLRNSDREDMSPMISSEFIRALARTNRGTGLLI